MPDAFEALREDHADMLEAVLQHQEALVRGDVDSAREIAHELHETLEAHARHEEVRLLPVLERSGKWSRIGEPRFYRDEHARLRAMAAELVAATDGLDLDDACAHREIVLLLRSEHAFVTLLEHHQEREERGLFPDLERVTTPAERAAMLEPPD